MIEEMLKNSKIDENIKQLVMAAYVLGRTEALNDLMALKKCKFTEAVREHGEVPAEYENERFTL